MSDTDTYTFKNAASSLVLGISGQSQTAATNVVQESTGTADTYWHFMPMGNDQYNNNRRRGKLHLISIPLSM